MPHKIFGDRYRSMLGFFSSMVDFYAIFSTVIYPLFIDVVARQGVCDGDRETFLLDPHA